MCEVAVAVVVFLVVYAEECRDGNIERDRDWVCVCMLVEERRYVSWFPVLASVPFQPPLSLFVLCGRKLGPAAKFGP